MGIGLLTRWFGCKGHGGRLMLRISYRIPDRGRARLNAMKRLAVVLLFHCLCYAQTGVTVSSAGQVSDADEIRVGQMLAEKFAKEEGIAPSPQNEKIDAYLQKVGDQVAKHAHRRLPYRFHFDPSPGFKSAVGLPGGQVFVGGGILAYMDSEDQLAMVLGHEIEHIDLNQCRDRLVKVLATQHLSVKDADRLKAAPFLDGYGHDNEFAADREGATLAMEAGYSVDAAIRLLQTFVILGEQLPNTPKEAKANLEARMAQIRQLRDASTLAKHVAERPLALP
jgi:predicted Zn-dependent protease